MATSESHPRGDESMRPGSMSGTGASSMGTAGASTASSSYSGSMRPPMGSGASTDDDRGMDNPREAMGQVADQAQQKLRQAADTAQQQAKSQLGGQLDQVSDGLGSMAEAVSTVGKQLREKDQAQLAGLADQAAHRIERFSGYMKERDVDELIGDVERFARRQPMVFIGSAFALGLMAARFLKSSRPEPEMPYRPYAGTGMRPSYGARPYAGSGSMAGSGYMRRPSDYPSGGYANGGSSSTTPTRGAGARPNAGYDSLHSGMGATRSVAGAPMTPRSTTPMPTGSPSPMPGSGSTAGSPRPASSGMGPSAGWSSPTPRPTPAPGSPLSGSSGSTTPASTPPMRPTGQPYGSESTDRPEERR